MKNLKYIITLLLLLVSVNVAQSKRIKFTLQWTAQSQFVGYYVAQELGYYKNLGLDVEINHVSTSTGINNHLNDCDALTLKLYDAISLISNGLDVVNILQTSQHSSLVVVARHNDIKSLSDLKGRKVGIWSASFRELAEGISQDKGLNIEWVPFVQNINLFISGAIDATFAVTYGEEYQLRMSGFENNPYIYLSDAGYDFPEDGLYIKADYCKKYPNQATQYILTEDDKGECTKSFKTFCGCVERSNAGFVTQWGDNFGQQFKGKKIGGVFGEQMDFYNGEEKKNRILRWFCQIDKVSDATVPDLTESKAFKEHKTDDPIASAATSPDGFMNIPDGLDEELPFN